MRVESKPNEQEVEQGLKALDDVTARDHVAKMEFDGAGEARVLLGPSDTLNEDITVLRTAMIEAGYFPTTLYKQGSMERATLVVSADNRNSNVQESETPTLRLVRHPEDESNQLIPWGKP